MTQVVWAKPDLEVELEAELQRMLIVLKDMEDVEEVWLFGSTVDGRLHSGSDLDLLVVSRTEEAVGSRAVSLAKKLGPRVPVDLFVFTPHEVSQGGRFLDYVQRHGRRLL